MVQQTVVVPQLHFIDGRRHPFRCAEADPLWSSIEILQLQYIDKVIDAFCAGPAGSCAVVGDSSRSHSCSSY